MNKIKTYTLKGLFVLISTVVMLFVVNIVSYLMLSKPQETFLNYSLNFMKFSLYFLFNMSLICGIVFFMMHYVTKIYNKLFVKS